MSIDKIRKFLFKFWPIIFILIIWFIFAYPYFLQHKVPYASTYQVNFFPPWSHYEKFWGPVKNNAMPDIHGQIYPWKKFTIDTFKNGQIPLWNPYSFSGNPHLANFQSAVLSPFNLLFFIFSFIDAWSILVLLQPLLAGLFTYLFVREINISRAGSLISSISFMFCGFIVVWMAYGTLSMTIAFLPLMLFAIEKSFKSSSMLPLILLSFVLPISFFSGHFQTSLYLVIFVASFFIFRTITTKKYRKAIMVGLFLIFGLLMALPQLLPSIEFYNNSVRSGIFINGGGIPFYYLVNIFSPDFFGNPVTRNDWFGYYAEWASFIGIIPLVLAFFSLFSKRRILARFFFIAALIVLVAAIDSSLHKLLGSLHIPVLSTSTPSRIIVLFSFAFAIASGFGLDALKEIIIAKRMKKIFYIFAGGGILLILLWMLVMMSNLMPADKELIAKRNLVLPTLVFIGSISMISISLFSKKFLLFSIYFLLCAASFDSVRFAQKWMPFDPINLVYPNTAIIDAVEKNINGGRIFGNLGAEVTTYYGIPSLEGYDPLYIDRYGTFIRGARDGDFLLGERSVVKLDRRGKYTDRVLDLLGVNLIFHPNPDTNQGWAYPVWNREERYKVIYKDNKFQLFHSNQALPKAILYYDYEVVGDKKDLLKRFYSEEFAFKNTLLLDQVPPVGRNLSQGILNRGEATILLYAPNEVIVDVVTDYPSLLFLSDNYYLGWRATVDEKDTKIYKADYAFRALAVDKGKHTVRFIYDPLSFRLGIYAAGIGIFGIVGAIFIRRKRA